MEQQTPFPPKSRMKPRKGQKRAIFPSLIWGEGGLGFPFILSKIVGPSNTATPPDWQIQLWQSRLSGTTYFQSFDGVNFSGVRKLGLSYAAGMDLLGEKHTSISHCCSGRRCHINVSWRLCFRYLFNQPSCLKYCSGFAIWQTKCHEIRHFAASHLFTEIIEV